MSVYCGSSKVHVMQYRKRNIWICGMLRRRLHGGGSSLTPVKLHITAPRLRARKLKLLGSRSSVTIFRASALARHCRPLRVPCRGLYLLRLAHGILEPLSACCLGTRGLGVLPTPNPWASRGGRASAGERRAQGFGAQCFSCRKLLGFMRLTSMCWSVFSSYMYSSCWAL